jgi:hypothetical protein
MAEGIGMRRPAVLLADDIGLPPFLGDLNDLLVANCDICLRRWVGHKMRYTSTDTIRQPSSANVLFKIGGERILATHSSPSTQILLPNPIARTNLEPHWPTSSIDLSSSLHPKRHQLVQIHADALPRHEQPDAG